MSVKVLPAAIATVRSFFAAAPNHLTGMVMEEENQEPTKHGTCQWVDI